MCGGPRSDRKVPRRRSSPSRECPHPRPAARRLQGHGPHGKGWWAVGPGPVGPGPPSGAGADHHGTGWELDRRSTDPTLGGTGRKGGRQGAGGGCLPPPCRRWHGPPNHGIRRDCGLRRRGDRSAPPAAGHPAAGWGGAHRSAARDGHWPRLRSEGDRGRGQHRIVPRPAWPDVHPVDRRDDSGAIHPVRDGDCDRKGRSSGPGGDQQDGDRRTGSWGAGRRWGGIGLREVIQQLGQPPWVPQKEPSQHRLKSRGLPINGSFGSAGPTTGPVAAASDEILLTRREQGLEPLQRGHLGLGTYSLNHGAMGRGWTGGLLAMQQPVMQLPHRIAKPGKLHGSWLAAAGVLGTRGQPGAH